MGVSGAGAGDSEEDEAAGAVLGGQALVDVALVGLVGALDDDLVELGDSGLGRGSFRFRPWAMFAVHGPAR